MTTAADLMALDVPRADLLRTVGEMMADLGRHAWDEVGHVYLVNDRAELVGQVPIEGLLQARDDRPLADLARPRSVRPSEDWWRRWCGISSASGYT